MIPSDLCRVPPQHTRRLAACEGRVLDGPASGEACPIRIVIRLLVFRVFSALEIGPTFVPLPPSTGELTDRGGFVLDSVIASLVC